MYLKRDEKESEVVIRKIPSVWEIKNLHSYIREGTEKYNPLVEFWVDYFLDCHDKRTIITSFNDELEVFSQAVRAAQKRVSKENPFLRARTEEAKKRLEEIINGEIKNSARPYITLWELNFVLEDFIGEVYPSG